MTTNKCKKVRCLVCNEILTYENDDTSVLVDHLNLEHSGLDVFRFLAHCQVSNSKINKRTLSVERGCSLEGGDILNEPAVCKKNSKTYKTTVEKWSPGPQNIICPKCGKEGQPVIKKQKNKMAKTPLGALCMLGCWPFCFLPFLFRREQFLDLYCCCCKHFIGTYDKRKCCMIQPNKCSETSESAENVLDRQRTKKTDDVSRLENVGVKINVEGVKALNQVSERVGFSIDASGPSTDYSYLKREDDVVPSEMEQPLKSVAKPMAESTGEPVVEPAGKSIAEPIGESIAEPTGESIAEPPGERTVQSEQMVEAAEDVSAIPLPAPASAEPSAVQPRVRLAPEVEEYEESRTVTVGPPPSYSFVMKQKKKSLKPRLPEPVVPNRPPPPTYSGNRGLCLPPEESRFERICNLPSLSEPLWRSHSQPALCPRCGIIILTTIHSHDSVATHVTALALCLFGCWPCCLLPYCMNICKNTYHHCPICQSFLGAYSPW